MKSTQVLTHLLDCTYDQPSNRRRNPAPQYVENLEHRVHRAETLLHILIPNLDLNDPGIDAAVAQGWIPGAPGKGNPAAAHRPPNHASRPVEKSAHNNSDTNLESMVRAVAQMDMDESGHWDYHGHSSGLSFVRRMREQLGDLMGPETVSTPFLKTLPRQQVLDSPKSSAESPMMSDMSPGASDLPPRDVAEGICRIAVNDAAALLRVVHQPTFWQSFERLYSTQPDQYTNEDYKFLPLFHSALALGHLFSKDEHSSLTREGYQNAIQQGFAHFKTARQMMDIVDCRDLTSLQAIIMMTLFLQSSAKLSQCYAYIGVALHTALRMGLHRSYSGKFNPIEAETRKRVFWVIRKLEIYVAAMIGLPLTLSDDDIDQDFPLEVDDEYVTKDGIKPMPEGSVSLMAAFNAHTDLVMVLEKVVRKVYPLKTPGSQSPDKTYSVPFSAIREIENDLEQWKNALPPILSPSPAPDRYHRVQQLLRLSYAHVQVMLYRPFLHFTANEKRSTLLDQRAYACAASHVNVSRNIIHITAHMKQSGLLNGAYWFIMYTTFFSILSLVYFAAENPENPTTQAVMKDAIQGRDVLASLATRSMAADRTSATLNAVFEKLPPWMQEGQQNPTMSKKRPFVPSPQPGAVRHAAIAQASRSHPDVSSLEAVGPATSGLQKRASTFPRHDVQMQVNGSPTSFQSSWPTSGTSSSFGPQTPTTNGLDPNALLQFSQRNALNQGLQDYSAAQSFSNAPLPELSAMMFPTADEPFAYPTQPLAAFENNPQFAKNNPYTQAQAFNAMNASHPVGLQQTRTEDNIEAQYFALPPYIQERQQQLQQQHAQRHQPQQQHGMGFVSEPMSFTNGQSSMGTPTTMQMPNGWSGQQNMPQGPLSDINFQDLFGSADWNSMLMSSGGYPAQ